MSRLAFGSGVLVISAAVTLGGCPTDPTGTGSATGATTGSTGMPTTGGSSSGDTGQATAVASGDGSAGTTSTSSGGLDETGTTETGMVDSSGSGSSSGDPLCGPDDPGCGCDGIDEPDVAGMDDNGDGIDGLAFCSVFVSTLGGNDGNDGLSTDEPVATLARGIEVSQSFSPPRPVLVAEGTYVETVTLGNGTSLYGGYDASSWTRDLKNNDVVILATEDRAIIANDIDEPTEIDGFTVLAIDVVAAGASTYGLWVTDASPGMLRVDYCTVMAGSAGAGADGADGSSGPPGGNGTDALLGNGGQGGASACGAVGGDGGAGDVCPSQDGDPGQAGGDATMVGAGGPAGSSNCAGCFDSASPGSPGFGGGVGANGTAGQAAADDDGDFSMAGLWLPPLATAGTDGANGGGGGGGG
ncbi:MAG: hypothetical protein K0V04_07365, partial [Deltaproteobacteria bacterium]|nr:hypothetical protein [Deltaproteobacteria bacterium]